MTPNVPPVNRILPMESDLLDKESEAIGDKTHVRMLKYDKTSQSGLRIEHKTTLFLKSKERSAEVAKNESIPVSAQSPSNSERRDSSQSKSPEKKKPGLLRRLGRCIFGKSNKKQVFPDEPNKNQLSVDIPSTTSDRENAEITKTKDTPTTPQKSDVFSRVLCNLITPVKSGNIKTARIKIGRSPGNDSVDAVRKPMSASSAAKAINKTEVCTPPLSPVHKSPISSDEDETMDASQVLIDFLARKTQTNHLQEAVSDSPEKSLLLAMARLNGLKSRIGTKSYMTVEQKAKYMRVRREFFRSTVFRNIKYRMSKNERQQYMVATSLERVAEEILLTRDIPTTPGKTILLAASEGKMEDTGHKPKVSTNKVCRRLNAHLDDLLAKMEQVQMVRTDGITRAFSDVNVANQTAKANGSCEITPTLPTNLIDSPRSPLNSEAIINNNAIASFKSAVAQSVKGEATFLDI